MNTEDYGKNLDRISEWIKTADQKVSIFLAFQGIILMGIFPVLFKQMSDNYLLFPKFLLYFIMFSVGIILYGVVKSVIAIIPKLDNSHKKSIIYFKDIASMNISEYKKQVRTVDKEKYDDYLLEQIHILSSIAKKKHDQFRDAIVVFFFGIILLLACMLVFFNYCYVGI